MKKRILACLLVLAMMVSFAGCGGSSSSEGEADESASVKEEEEEEVSAIVGAWECVGIDLSGEGTYMDADEFKEMMELELTDFMSLSFWDNGNGLITFGSAFMQSDDPDDVLNLPCTWTETDGKVELAADSDEKYTCSFNEDGQMEFSIISTYTSTEDGEETTVEDAMSMLLERTGDPDKDNIYALDFNFSKEKTSLMSALNRGGGYLIEGNTVYGYYDGDRLAMMEVKKDGDELTKVSETILKEDVAIHYLTKQGDKLYYTSKVNDVYSGVWTYDLATEEDTEIVSETVDYLSVTDNYIFYCDGDYHIYRADLDGKNAKEVYDGAAYYVYAINDDFLIFQDDADNETIVIYNINTKEKQEVSTEHSHFPTIAEGYVYYSTYIDDVIYPARTNLATGEVEVADYELTYSGFYIYDGKIYFNDGFVISLDKWNNMSANAPSTMVSTAYLFVDDNYCIQVGLSHYILYSMGGGDSSIYMMTDEDYAKIAED